MSKCLYQCNFFLLVVGLGERYKGTIIVAQERIFHLNGDVTITGEGLQNLVLCSALRAFEQGGIYLKLYVRRMGR
jgi:hypothetical protein